MSNKKISKKEYLKRRQRQLRKRLLIVFFSCLLFIGLGFALVKIYYKVFPLEPIYEIVE
ncbi:MAG: hypothetical protein WBO70_04390 [Erysipelotrichaceae bacterium]